MGGYLEEVGVNPDEKLRLSLKSKWDHGDDEGINASVRVQVPKPGSTKKGWILPEGWGEEVEKMGFALRDHPKLHMTPQYSPSGDFTHFDVRPPPPPLTALIEPARHNSPSSSGQRPQRPQPPPAGAPATGATPARAPARDLGASGRGESAPLASLAAAPASARAPASGAAAKRKRGRGGSSSISSLSSSSGSSFDGLESGVDDPPTEEDVLEKSPSAGGAQKADVADVADEDSEEADSEEADEAFRRESRPGRQEKRAKRRATSPKRRLRASKAELASEAKAAEAALEADVFGESSPERSPERRRRDLRHLQGRYRRKGRKGLTRKERELARGLTERVASTRHDVQALASVLERRERARREFLYNKFLMSRATSELRPELRDRVIANKLHVPYHDALYLIDKEATRRKSARLAADELYRSYKDEGMQEELESLDEEAIDLYRSLFPGNTELKKRVRDVLVKRGRKDALAEIQKEKTEINGKAIALVGSYKAAREIAGKKEREETVERLDIRAKELLRRIPPFLTGTKDKLRYFLASAIRDGGSRLEATDLGFPKGVQVTTGWEPIKDHRDNQAQDIAEDKRIAIEGDEAKGVRIPNYNSRLPEARDRISPQEVLAAVEGDELPPEGKLRRFINSLARKTVGGKVPRLVVEVTDPKEATEDYAHDVLEFSRPSSADPDGEIVEEDLPKGLLEAFSSDDDS